VHPSIMWTKLEALDTVHIVRPPLEKLYDSLSDEQKARFNAVEAEVGQQATQPHMPTREDRRRRYWQALAVDRRPVLGRDIVSVKAAGWWAGADRRGDIDWRLALIVPERKISHDRRRWVRGSPNVVRSNLRY